MLFESLFESSKLLGDRTDLCTRSCPSHLIPRTPRMASSSWPTNATTVWLEDSRLLMTTMVNEPALFHPCTFLLNRSCRELCLQRLDPLVLDSRSSVCEDEFCAARGTFEMVVHVSVPVSRHSTVSRASYGSVTKLFIVIFVPRSLFVHRACIMYRKHGKWTTKVGD